MPWLLQEGRTPALDSSFEWRSPSSRLVLTAVLEILATRGYDGLTLAEISARSGPAGPVLSPSVDPDDLVIAALRHVQLLVAFRPTGSLRGDLLALLGPWRRPRSRDEMVIAAVLSAAEWRPSLKAAVTRALDRPVAQAVGEVLSRALDGDESASWAQTLNWIVRGLILERLRAGSRSAVDLEELVDFLLSRVDGRGAIERGPRVVEPTYVGPQDSPRDTRGPLVLRSDGSSARRPSQDPGTRKVAVLPLIPGHVATEAEVWLWTGTVPQAGDQPGPWVVLRTDDWPMSPAIARELAGALLSAADRADAPVPASRARGGQSPDVEP